jgi:peptidoglycan/LPS O-acetylase OafA/YrhL
VVMNGVLTTASSQPDLSTRGAASPAPNTSAPQNSMDHFLALRGLAALLVLMGHCNYRHNLTNAISSIGGHDVSWLLNPNASAAVIVFFTLSGYLMGKLFRTERYSLSWSGTRQFWKNRILRICPLYYSLFLIISLYAYTGVYRPENWHVLSQVLTFTYLDFSKDIFSGQFWSISTEMQFYLVVPLIALFVQKYLKSIPATLLALVTGVGAVEIYKYIAYKHCFVNHVLSDPLYFTNVYSALPANLDAFLLGFLLNPILARWPRKEKIKKYLPIVNPLAVGWLLMFLCACTTAALHYRMIHRNSTEFIVIPLIAAVSTALFILIAERCGAEKLTALSAGQMWRNPLRLLDLLGVLSYGLYLWHFSMINRVELLVTESQPVLHYFEVVLLSTIFCCGLAALTYVAIERPCNRLRKPGTN